ncbi:MAG TPA: trehalose-6-phosphate synthase [Planctomycetes bacterium]|nr:trehalose-6-phosphate synthase [Planctomycetota bacterium]
MTPSPQGLTIIANRLPVQRIEGKRGLRWQTSPGGLVSSMIPVLRQGGRWVGWGGSNTRDLEPFRHEGIDLVPVSLQAEEVEQYYSGFSNRTLWPLYHDALRPPEFHRRWWRTYQSVNEKFAEIAAESMDPNGTCWVHDFHLQLVPSLLKRRHPGARIGFFLHIPFPPTELFAQLPWRVPLLEGMLGASLIGFQTPYGASNFRSVAKRFLGAEVEGDNIYFRGRKTRTGSFPISIDVRAFEKLTKRPEVRTLAEELRRDLGGKRKLVLGIDRLDYTKGIDMRLRAIETLLYQKPELAKKFVFVQVGVPSRENVPDYETLRTRIESIVGRINGRFGEPGCVPVQYLYRNLKQETLVSYYMAADIMLITPLRDGMNLVAKEFVATKTQDEGALILSEFTGAANEFQDALLVNPHDLDGVANTLHKAILMDPAEGRHRMRRLRQQLHRNDVFHWSETFLESLNELEVMRV